MKRTSILWVCLILLQLLEVNLSEYVHADETRDERENKMGNAAVRDGLLLRDELKVELGIILLGVKSSESSLRFLADLIQYRLDAGAGESYDCYVFSKKAQILPFLRRIDPSELASRCRREVGNIGGIAADVEKVCSTQISTKLSDLLRGIEGKVECPEEDF